jgi:hypothetical protein
MKKAHKILPKSERYKKERYTACRVENKTWAYIATTRWQKVTCQNCLKKQK